MNLSPIIILFYIFSFLIVLSSIAVILSKNPIHSAILLVVTFFFLAGIYALLGAVFLATMQILVYAGAIMVLVVFVLMLLSLRDEEHQPIWDHSLKKAFIVISTVLFLSGFLYLLVSNLSWIQSEQQELNSYKYVVDGGNQVLIEGNTAVISAVMLREFIVPFEAISLLILSSVIGVILVGKKITIKKLRN